MPFLDPVFGLNESEVVNALKSQSAQGTTTIDDIERLVSDLQRKIKILRTVSTDGKLNDEARKGALVQTRDVLRALKTPQEGITNYCSIVCIS